MQHIKCTLLKFFSITLIWTILVDNFTPSIDYMQLNIDLKQQIKNIVHKLIWYYYFTVIINGIFAKRYLLFTLKFVGDNDLKQ